MALPAFVGLSLRVFLLVLLVVFLSNIEPSEQVKIQRTNFFSNINSYLMETVQDADSLEENLAKVKEYKERELDYLNSKLSEGVDILVPEQKSRAKSPLLERFKACFGAGKKETKETEQEQEQEEEEELDFSQKDDLLTNLATIQQQVEACDCLDQLRLISKSDACSQTNRRLIEQAAAAVDAERASWHREYSRVDMILSAYKALIEKC